MADVSVWGQAVPAWMAAMGTCFATAFAVYVAWREQKNRKTAEAERDELREAAQAGVASRVAAWMEQTSLDHRDRFGLVDRDILRVRVRNASDQAVVNVKAVVIYHDGHQSDVVGEWSIIPPLETFQNDQTLAMVGYNERPFLRLSFEDPAGRHWVRGGDGHLTLATNDDSA